MIKIILNDLLLSTGPTSTSVTAYVFLCAAVILNSWKILIYAFFSHVSPLPKNALCPFSTTSLGLPLMHFVAQSCLTLCNPMNCSPSGSSVHGTSQERVLEWVAMSFSRGSSQPRDQTQVFHTAGGFFTVVQ